MLHTMRNMAFSDNSILTEAIRTLERRLPLGWRTDVEREVAGRDRRIDAIVRLRSPDGEEVGLLVEVKSRVEPAAVQQLAALLAAGGGIPVVVAPFLSPRTQGLLREARLRYLDLTGNIWLTSDRPAVFIESKGADSDPRREERPARSLKGAKAARVVRALCDLRPPFRVRQLAHITDTDAGYVSRLLVLLERDALIQREPRGPVTRVEWQALIRRWTADYGVLKSNRAVTYLDPRGVSTFADRLRETELEYAITGSLGAARLAPVAAPALVMCFVRNPELAAEGLQLRPASAGANVMLLEPFDPVAYERSWQDEGLTFAAPSQIAADLFTSPGRGPAEAEALLEWMAGNEDAWRS